MADAITHLKDLVHGNGQTSDGATGKKDIHAMANKITDLIKPAIVAHNHPEVIEAHKNLYRKKINIFKLQILATGIGVVAGGILPFLIGKKRLVIKLVIAAFSSFGTGVLAASAVSVMGNKSISNDRKKLEEMENRLWAEDKEARNAHKKDIPVSALPALTSVAGTIAKTFASAVTPPTQSHTQQIAQEPKAASSIPNP